MRVQDRVRLYGRLPYKDVSKILLSCVIGVAPYKPTSMARSGSWAHSDSDICGFTQSVMECFAHGLPVVMTEGMGDTSSELARHDIGIATPYDPVEFANAVSTLFGDQERLRRMSRNAIAYARGLEWERVYDRAFSELRKSICEGYSARS
jgi:glycosyltransferase involved in cell wall biosynthesis